MALTLYLAIKGCRPPVITISSSRLRIRRTALLVLNPKKKSQIAIKIKALINKRALVTHHVSRSSHAYKHAFRLNLTLISLNTSRVHISDIYNHVRIFISSLESQQDNSEQTTPEETISVLSVCHLLAIQNHTETECLEIKPKYE